MLAVAGIGLWSVARGLKELEAGQTTMLGWPTFVRANDPIRFWLTLGGRFLGCVGAAALFGAFFMWSR